MSLTTKENLNMILQVIKKLLSLKADKSEVATKVDRSELLCADDAIKLAVETGIVEPVVSNDGYIFADENGAIYSL